MSCNGDPNGSPQSPHEGLARLSMLHSHHLGRSAAGSSRARRYRTDVLSNSSIWEHLDFSQELGDSESYGHTGCVNGLCWSDSGDCLLSGSDDTRICMWIPDANTPPTPSTPHPFILSDVINTGHRANIFSSKFLPNASHPTIVSAAGDSQIRVFDVERLERTVHGGPGDGELDGRSGPGVRVLRCHTDRAKRISVEDNPDVFLSVSEDGTVRQHDLRTTHTCRSNCPAPLLETVGDISLYTLSVSPLQPYLFTVAGTSPFAYLQDRRMVSVAKKEWEIKDWRWVDQGGKVQCVRRFGLKPENEGEDPPTPTTARRRRLGAVRHVTAVEMSKDVAEDLIVSFSGHSVALFSIHDSPPETSARAPRSSSLSPTTRKRARTSTPHLEAVEEGSWEVVSSRGASPGTESEIRRTSPPLINGHHNDDRPMACPLEEASGPLTRRAAARPTSGHAPPDEGWETLGSQPPQVESGIADASRLHPPHPKPPSDVPQMRPARVNHDSVNADNVYSKDTIPSSSTAMEVAPERPSEVGQDDDDEEDWEEDGDSDMNVDLERLMTRAAREELGLDDDDDDEDDDGDEDDEMEDVGLYPATDELDVYPLVPCIHPRMNYTGARNVQTVKDVTFLGIRSDKVCSGSDDGNWFVWDKLTGKLEGIWEGDGQVVNVVEQHPSLPLIACSGIDSTVKIFSPQTHPNDPTHRRIDHAEQIIKANEIDRHHRFLGFRRGALLRDYFRILGGHADAEGIEIRAADDDEEGTECRVQ